jgi:hypothetical protein
MTIKPMGGDISTERQGENVAIGWVGSGWTDKRGVVTTVYRMANDGASEGDDDAVIVREIFDVRS